MELPNVADGVRAAGDVLGVEDLRAPVVAPGRPAAALTYVLPRLSVTDAEPVLLQIT